MQLVVVRAMPTKKADIKKRKSSSKSRAKSKTKKAMPAKKQQTRPMMREIPEDQVEPRADRFESENE
jgi:hypothetical protein